MTFVGCEGRIRVRTSTVLLHRHSGSGSRRTRHGHDDHEATGKLDPFLFQDDHGKQTRDHNSKKTYAPVIDAGELSRVEQDWVALESGVVAQSDLASGFPGRQIVSTACHCPVVR
jgi:hypothetical protein